MFAKQTRKGLKGVSTHAAPPDAGSSSLVPAVASVEAGMAIGAAGMGAGGAAGGCAFLANHHVSPPGDHSA